MRKVAANFLTITKSVLIRSMKTFVCACCVALLLVNFSSTFAQNFILSGFVEDASSGEKLIGANVFDKGSLKGTSANLYGFYSLTLPAGKHTIIASFVGFEPKSVEIDLQENITLDFKLGGSLSLKEVVVEAEQTSKIQEESQMSVAKIPIQTIQKIPALFGERDVLKALQLLPGVQSGSEGSSGLYVRGGGPDQNLMLLDGVPVYNASHLFGFFSVFNPDAINSVELIKGGFPAHYGGRLSSVVDIRMKEGNMKEFHGNGSIGIVSSKLTLEGPIVKDKASFIVSGRRTYIDILSRPIIKNQFKRDGIDGVAGYYFYDLNGKVNWKITDKDRIYLSTYLGDDKFYLDTEQEYQYTSTQRIRDQFGVNLNWGNLTTALRYNKVISPNLFANFTATYSRYNFSVGQSSKTTSDPTDASINQNFSYEYSSGIYDWSGRVDFDYIPNTNHHIKFGGGDIYHTFIPGINVFNSSFGGASDIDTTFGASRIFGHEYFIYAEDDIKIGSRFKANVGLHFAGFVSNNNHFKSLQPRASGRYLINELLSVKASYAEMQQYIHLLTNAGIGLPTDLWVPATENVKPQYSRQVAVGIAQSFLEKFEISIEGYYKWMNNLIEYKEGASFFTGGTNWEDQVELGRGWSYGAELFLQKKVGKTTGWIGYTLSWTTRQFDNLNFGKPFPYRYDRRHDLSIVLVHEFNERIDVAATWVYGTGNAVSLPLERYAGLDIGPYSSGFLSNEVQHFEERNGYRMAAYHRLDVGVNFHKKKKYWDRTWSIGAYNAYSRKNPFFLNFESQFNAPGSPNTESKQLVQYSLFPIIPYISYGFKF